MIDFQATFTNTNDVAFPLTEAVNVSAPGAGDGTEFVAALVNDIWGRAQALLDYAGLSPDGVQEAPDTAQFLTALSKGYGIGPGIGVIYWKNGTPAASGDRVILLQGQVIEISSYPLLAAAVYVGDAKNGTAPAFYKTSDAGGTTRSTSGTYMVMPDTRAVSLKGVGNQTINTRVKTGPASVGAKIEDTGQEITGHFDARRCADGAPEIVNKGQAFYSETDVAATSNTNAQSVAAYAAQRILFSSAYSPNARTSTQTQDCTIGTNFGITY